MYKYLNLVLLASMAQFANGSADVVDGKVYVRPRQVRMKKDRILVRTQEGVFEAPHVARDDNGIYVHQHELVAVAPDMAKMRNRSNHRHGGCCHKKRFGNKRWKQKKQWKQQKGQHKQTNAVDVNVAAE